MTKQEEITEIKEEITKLQERIEQIEKSEKQKTGRWKPDLGKVYWFIVGYGVVRAAKWANDDFDNAYYAIGNCFPTKEAAEFEVERLKVIAEMREFAFEPDWDDNDEDKYFILYNHENNYFGLDWNKWMQGHDFHFESEEQIQACINSVGKDRIKKYYFRIKEE